MTSPESPVVLLVDDQPIIGEAVRRMLLTQPDIAFHYCHKGKEALSEAARLNPTVILQDLVMPDADGLDLVRGYRSQPSTELTPLVVLSSREEGATKAEAFARGANDYIVKLPEPAELIARIRYHSRGYLSLLQRNEAFEALRRSQRALTEELGKAASYVRSLLPKPIDGPISVDWRFVPSASLGGDCFDYLWIDEDHLAIYLLDVCGHGVGPALLGVSALNTVRSIASQGNDIHNPSAVLAKLNAAFPMDQHGGMFMTIWYGVYCRSKGELVYAGGGHPPALLGIPGPHPEVHILESTGLPIGVSPEPDFPSRTAHPPRGSLLLLYSDGATEVWESPGHMWGIEGLRSLVERRTGNAANLLDDLHSHVLSLAGSDTLADDFSALLLRLP